MAQRRTLPVNTTRGFSATDAGVILRSYFVFCVMDIVSMTHVGRVVETRIGTEHAHEARATAFGCSTFGTKLLNAFNQSAPLQGAQ